LADTKFASSRLPLRSCIEIDRRPPAYANNIIRNNSPAGAHRLRLRHKRRAFYACFAWTVSRVCARNRIQTKFNSNGFFSILSRRLSETVLSPIFQIRLNTRTFPSVFSYRRFCRVRNFTQRALLCTRPHTKCCYYTS